MSKLFTFLAGVATGVAAVFVWDALDCYDCDGDCDYCNNECCE